MLHGSNIAAAKNRIVTACGMLASILRQHFAGKITLFEFALLVGTLALRGHFWNRIWAAIT